LDNVDGRELAKFEALGPGWWDPRGKMASLHAINPLRAEFILGRLGKRAPRILDAGCGGGILSEALAEAGAHVTGIDPSPAAIQAAQDHARSRGLKIDYRQGSVESFAAKNAGAFDAVAAMEILEHVPRPDRIVAACARALASGGRAFFSTIHRSPKAWLFVVFGGEVVLRLLPRGSHEYRKLIRPAELRGWAEAGGLEHEESAALLYNPFVRRFRIEAGRLGDNYLMCFAKKARPSERLGRRSGG
jgi:2-polyprenyl-6-hydroxyphenyl methylase/3-demethylubiquinone-9 3-methyltransferase